MKKNKLAIAIGVVVLIGIVSLLAYRAQNRGASDGIIRVGAILPLTGVVAEAGEDMQRGVLLARDELSNKGVHLDLKIEDGKYLSKDSISCFNRLTAIGIDYLLIAGQVPAASVKPLVSKRQVKTMATIAGGKKIPEANDYMYRCYFSSYRVGEILGEYSNTNLLLKSVSILKIDNDWGSDAADGFRKAYNGDIQTIETYDIADKNIRPQVSKVLEGKPSGIFVTGFGPGFSICFNRIRESGYTGIILTDPQILEPSYQRQISNLSGIYYVCSEFDLPDRGGATQFFSREYVKKYKTAPSLFSAFGYTSLKILVDKNLYLRDKGDRYFCETPIGNICFDENGDAILPLYIKRFN